MDPIPHKMAKPTNWRTVGVVSMILFVVLNWIATVTLTLVAIWTHSSEWANTAWLWAILTVLITGGGAMLLLAIS